MIPWRLGDMAGAMGARYDGPDRDYQVTSITTDSRTSQPGELFLAIPGERFDGHDFVADVLQQGAIACVVQREWLVREPAHGGRVDKLLIVEDVVAALGRLAKHYRQSVMGRATVVVAITGSNGKTTTKSLLDHVLSGSFPGRAAPRNFNNHFGVPLTLLSAEADDRYLLVEIGSNAPGEVASLSEITSPSAGMITSIGEAHLEGFGGMAGVAAEKAALLRYVRKDGLSIVNIDRPEIEPYLARARTRKMVTVGHGSRARLCISNVRGDLARTTFELEGRFTVTVPMPGLHHAINGAMTFALARWFGMAPEDVIRRIGSFSTSPGRTCRFDVSGVPVIDDTYNANPASMLSAIHALGEAKGGRRVFVMGDMLELGRDGRAWHRQVVEATFEAGIEVLVGVGPATGDAIRHARIRSDRIRTILCQDSSAAVSVVRGLLAQSSAIWIKGSRAMALDQVVASLRDPGDQPAAVA